jgi:hypothetical protein
LADEQRCICADLPLETASLGYSRGMSSHDDRYARNDLPSTTGEFRAAPDISASTAQFKAFAKAYDSQPEQPWAAESWPEQPGIGDSPRAGSSRTAILVAAVILAAVVITVVVLAVG